MNFRHRLEFLFTRFLAWVARILPLSIAIDMGQTLGWIGFSLLRIRRQVTLENLRFAFPDKSELWVKKTAGACYRHFGRVAVELARLPKLNHRWIERNIDFRGRDVLEHCLGKDRGSIVLSGHFGNWEIMGATTAAMGFPISYIVTTQRNKGVEALIDNLRRGKNIEIIKTHDSPKKMIQALKNNRLLAVLSDQDAHEDGEFVPFFGRPASTPRGGPVLHLKTGSTLMFGYATGLPKGKWQVTFEEIPAPPSHLNINEKVKAILTHATERLEQEIRKHPEQWLWMHQRWKTQPPKEKSNEINS
jgi:KDO2-lipid IV(A) lauroyltransferase